MVANKFDDITGMVRGKLTAATLLKERNKQNSRVWLCRCECGNEVIYTSSVFKKKETCGCDRSEKLRIANTKHGLSRTKLYCTWTDMMHRCYNEKEDSYYLYGGRGITVCERWHDVTKFFEDMAGTYDPKLTLDRINNDGNYEPSNCKWSTKTEQARNRRSARLITHNGQTKGVSEWAEIYGLPFTTIYNRLIYGWSTEELFMPKGKAYWRKKACHLTSDHTNHLKE